MSEQQIENSNLVKSNMESNTRDLFAMTFSAFELADKNTVINSEDAVVIIQELITKYYTYISPDYNSMIYNFKKKYINNEMLVEKNDTPEEALGLSLVYDYIQNFDKDKDDFNIFINGLIIHETLYKPLDETRDHNHEEYLKLLEEAKKEKNIKKYKEAIMLSKCNEGSKFGGQLRKGQVRLLETYIEVPSSEDAIRFYNSFLTPEKKKEYKDLLEGDDVFSYIDYCVNTCADLIASQPFQDGNKRTFRSLLNLMFKNRNLPPVYIEDQEKGIYKECLFKAIKNKDYADLDHFYYAKICDSIYELDVRPYTEQYRHPKTLKKENDNI